MGGQVVNTNGYKMNYIQTLYTDNCKFYVSIGIVSTRLYKKVTKYSSLNWYEKKTCTYSYIFIRQWFCGAGVSVAGSYT